MLRHRGRVALILRALTRTRAGALLGPVLALWALVAQGQDPVPALGRLSVSPSRPGPGQEVLLELPYAGPWPAALRWEGVDSSASTQARWIAGPPGEHTVRVQGLERRVAVQPGANRGELPSPAAQVRALPWVSGACEDARYPRLAGAWVVGCGPSGQVDRAEHLPSGRRVELERGARSPAVAAARLYATTLQHGLWRLPGSAPTLDGVMRVPFSGLGPPATDGFQAAVTTAEDVQVFALEGRLRAHLPARPAPWYPPAVGGGWVGWVDLREQALFGEDLYVRPPGAREGVPLVRRPGDQRHITASGAYFAWVEEAAVCVERMADGERRCLPAAARPSRALSLDGPVPCWEELGPQDIELRCADGVLLRRPGHQRSPSRVGPWLVFREGVQVLLATLDAQVLDDDDLRAYPLGATVPDAAALRGARVEGGVRYLVELPEGRWRVERHEGAGWAPGELLGPGLQQVEAPWGDAVRLRGELAP